MLIIYSSALQASGADDSGCPRRRRHPGLCQGMHMRTRLGHDTIKQHVDTKIEPSVGLLGPCCPAPYLTLCADAQKT